MHRSYVKKQWMDAFLKDSKITLPDEVLHRFSHVVRIQDNEEIALFDGYGRELRGLIKKGSFLTMRLIEQKRPSPEITLMQAAILEPKITETLKRATEFGVDRFIIFNAQKSDKFLYNKIKKREDRLLRVVIDAARQSGRLFVPEILFVDSLLLALKEMNDGDFGIFGDLKSQLLLSHVLKHQYREQNIVIVVGPEGGLDEKEIALLEKENLKGLMWAPYTLRTEFAALAPLSIINAYLGRA